MYEAKIFDIGGSQVVRLPKECHFAPGQKVIIKKVDHKVVIVPADKINYLFESSFGGASPDFFAEGRVQDLQGERGLET